MESLLTKRTFLFYSAMDFETYSLDDPKVTLATYVAKRREPQRMSRKDAELQFPGGLGKPPPAVNK